jgi:hypothetical protein
MGEGGAIGDAQKIIAFYAWPMGDCFWTCRRRGRRTNTHERAMVAILR